MCDAEEIATANGYVYLGGGQVGHLSRRYYAVFFHKSIGHVAKGEAGTRPAARRCAAIAAMEGYRRSGEAIKAAFPPSPLETQ